MRSVGNLGMMFDFGIVGVGPLTFRSYILMGHEVTLTAGFAIVTRKECDDPWMVERYYKARKPVPAFKP